MKRLVRSQLYCLFATSAGLYVFFTEYKSFPLDLLHHWGSYHPYLFEAACGHWLFSLLEDYLVGEEVIAHVIPLPDERPELYGWMLNGLLSHHVITVFAYSWCLATHKLSGLCMFGLMFEAPILLLNVRDLWACFEKEFLHPFKKMGRGEVSIFNGSMYFLWHVFRTVPCVLYPLSVFIWRPELNTLSIYSRCAYHFLDLLFCFVNFELIFGIVPRVLLDDLLRAGLMSKESHLFNVRVTAGEIDEDGKQLKKKRKKVDEEYVVDVENQKKESMVGLQMMGLEAVGKHNTAEDCWMAIDGNVYDLSAFLSQHPGGDQVLLEVAGKDASKEFLAAGHSMKARKMMTKFMVGHVLGRAYEQKNDVAPDPGLRGDFNKSFEVGRMYTTYDNSPFCTLCLTGLSVIFLQHATYQLGTPKHLNNVYLYHGNVASALGPIIGLLVICVLMSLFVHTLSGDSRTMEGQLGNTAPLRWRACLSLFADWRTHVSSLCLLLYLVADFVVLSIKHGHAVRAMRVSILLTCALELSWRTFTGPVMLPRTTTFCKALLTCTPVVCLVAAAGLDLFCTSHFISRGYSHHVAAAEEEGSENFAMTPSVFALNILASAFVRFLFVRSIQPPRNESVEFNMTLSRQP